LAEEPSNLRLALQTSPTRQWAAQMPLFQALSQRVGQTARDVTQFFAGDRARLLNEVQAGLGTVKSTHPALLDDLAEHRDMLAARQEYQKVIPPERMPFLYQKATSNSLSALVTDPELSDVERAMMNDLETKGRSLGTWTAGRDIGLHEDPLN